MSSDLAQPGLEQDPNLALVHAAKAGDANAFAQLVARNTPLLFRVTRYILNSREDAEDVVQEAFLKAYLNLSTFEERARFSTWLTRIAVNAALVKLRNSGRAISVSLDEEREEDVPRHENLADWHPNPEQLYSSCELRSILQKALASLPHRSQVVFMLRDVEGLSINETAQMLGLTASAVKTCLFRTRLRLRDLLRRHFEPGMAKGAAKPGGAAFGTGSRARVVRAARMQAKNRTPTTTIVHMQALTRVPAAG